MSYFMFHVLSQITFNALIIFGWDGIRKKYLIQVNVNYS